MTNSFDKKKLTFIINILYIFLILLIVHLLISFALPTLLPFIIALFLSYLISPYVKYLNFKLKINKCFASIICLLAVLIIVIILVILFSVTIVSGLKQLLSVFPNIKSNIDVYINNLINVNPDDIFSKILYNLYTELINIDLTSFLKGSIGSAIIASFSGLMSSIPYLILSIIITFVATVFLSISFVEVKTFFLKQFSLKQQKLIVDIKKSAFSIGKSYLKTYTTLMLITFLELTVMFIIFDIRPAASIALVISVVDILPILGVGTILIPWSIINLIMGDSYGFIILIAIYVLITVIRQIIEPKIIGDNTGLHPIVALISIYVGLKLFGVFGMFIIPIIIIIIKDLQNKNYINLWK